MKGRIEIIRRRVVNYVMDIIIGSVSSDHIIYVYLHTPAFLGINVMQHTKKEISKNTTIILMI